MNIEIENVPEEYHQEIKKWIEIYAKAVFQKVDNPITTFIITNELEKKVLEFCSSENERKNRERLNLEKSVVTNGKTLPYVKDDKLLYNIVLHSNCLSSPAMFHETVIHEMIHVLDGILYFSKISKKPYLPYYIYDPTEYHPEYEYWSEYNANRTTTRIIKELNVQIKTNIFDLNREIEILFEKLKKAKYTEWLPERKNYVATVGLMDFNSCFLIVAGKSAEIPGEREKVKTFLSSDLNKKIFGDTLSCVLKTLDEIYETKSFDELFSLLSNLREDYDKVFSNFNQFSLYGGIDTLPEKTFA